MSEVVTKRPVLPDTRVATTPVAPLVPVASSGAASATAGAPLDELMLAMDVVDTLRHRELMLEREVEAENRDQRLLVRLREIYSAQGIAVTDDVLAQGVAALREERFAYTAPVPGFGRSLALLYVSRGRWGKWVGGTVAVVVAAALTFQFLIRGPEERALATLPTNLNSAYQTVVTTTRDPKALGEAQQLLAAGEAAYAQRDLGGAGAAVGQLRTLEVRLEQQYELRIVSRPGERSGFERYSDENPSGRNYYLIVEAIAPGGARLALPIRSEEDGGIKSVRKWGLRVDEATYRKVAADKQDDGIIEQNVVGEKRRGELDAQYTVATSGAAITKW
jgi:Family of unknown function (DUF6384)